MKNKNKNKIKISIITLFIVILALGCLNTKTVYADVTIPGEHNGGGGQLPHVTGFDDEPDNINKLYDSLSEEYNSDDKQIAQSGVFMNVEYDALREQYDELYLKYDYLSAICILSVSLNIFIFLIISSKIKKNKENNVQKQEDKNDKDSE